MSLCFSLVIKLSSFLRFAPSRPSARVSASPSTSLARPAVKPGGESLAIRHSARRSKKEPARSGSWESSAWRYRVVPRTANESPVPAAWTLHAGGFQVFGLRRSLGMHRPPDSRADVPRYAHGNCTRRGAVFPRCDFNLLLLCFLTLALCLSLLVALGSPYKLTRNTLPFPIHCASRGFDFDSYVFQFPVIFEFLGPEFARNYVFLRVEVRVLLPLKGSFVTM